MIKIIVAYMDSFEFRLHPFFGLWPVDSPMEIPPEARPETKVISLSIESYI